MDRSQAASRAAWSRSSYWARPRSLARLGAQSSCHRFAGSSRCGPARNSVRYRPALVSRTASIASPNGSPVHPARAVACRDNTPSTIHATLPLLLKVPTFRTKPSAPVLPTWILLLTPARFCDEPHEVPVERRPLRLRHKLAYSEVRLLLTGTLFAEGYAPHLHHRRMGTGMLRLTSHLARSWLRRCSVQENLLPP